jgi:predicted TIM-barrel fold metal-dependent hydrolase
MEPPHGITSPIFDCHCHIIDRRFPLTPNQGYLPPEFTCESYRHRADQLGIAGGAVVSGSFQAFDQTYLLDALERLGPGFVGVTQLPASVSDEELIRLDAAGVRALRFNVKRGGSAPINELVRMARRVYELVHWHTELYIDAAELGHLFATLLELPKISIDHLGLSKAGLPTLLRLVERGVRTKATGFGRVDFEVAPVLKELVAANPEAVMFGTDLPSTRAPRPFDASDIRLIVESVGESLARRLLYDNAAAFYRPRAALQPAS